MAATGRQRVRVRVTGVVQGVGFRPFVWRRAVRLGLTGWVVNDPGGVTVEVEGDSAAVMAFLDGFAAAAPPLAQVVAVELLDRPCLHDESAGFAILDRGDGGGSAGAVVPADIAPCAACLAEMADPHDRRFAHSFISCTDCGPRFTIIESIPYDRDATTMRDFRMCPACAAEYRDPGSRRFHAQTIACPECGPVVRIVWNGPGACPGPDAADGADAPAVIDAARKALLGGSIVAIKGAGGFQLACDATNQVAVQQLRARKRRPRKPFAVMIADVAAARRVAEVSEQERRLLVGRERPIVLLRRRTDAASLGERVAPGNDFLGVLLPSSPLHHQLCAGMPPLVMTSGNLAEEPIVTDDADALARLGPLADAFLLHDRRIVLPCDDSIVRCVSGLPLPIRRSRGYAPLPIRLARGGPAVLAVGGELKATTCVAFGSQAVMGQHVGDMGNLETLEALDASARHILTLLGVEPAAVAADMHPGYLSSDWAARFAAARGIPLLAIQHHEAHVASLLAEHGRDPAAADGFIGVCFDGTGYGRDGTIQGGEFFVVRHGDLRRAAHLAPWRLPGGDAAIRHPWRTALGLLHTVSIPADSLLTAIPATDRAVVEAQLSRGFGCTPTTSMGRLFDAVASLVGARHSIDYEAEAALNLEALASGADAADPRLAFAVGASDDPSVIDWRPLVAEIVSAVTAGEPAARLAAAFHAAVARMIVDTCRLLRDRGAGDTVGLTGGVFQNAVLVEQTLRRLHAAGFEVLTHHAVPPNDGGLALGQAVLARDALASA